MSQTSSSLVHSCCGGADDTRVAATRAAPIDGRFDLTDHFGRPVTERSFGDLHLLVFFGFTHCAVVCPRELAKLGTAIDRLGPVARRLQALYVTVDPLRDDPATMQAYVGRFRGKFIGLTGTPEQISAAKKSYRVYAEPVPDANAPGGYVVPHTAFAYLMAPGGRYETHLPHTLDVDEVVERLRPHLQ